MKPDDKKLAAYKAVASGVNAIQIDNAYEAAQILIRAKDKHKEIEEWRKEVTGPIKQGIAAFEREVKPVLAAWEAVADRCVAHLHKAERDDADLNRTIRETAEELHNEGDKAASAELLALSATRFELPEGLSRRETWVAIVEDINLVPEEFIERTPDTQALNHLARIQGYAAEVPGVRFEKKVTYARTGGKDDE